MIQPFHSPSLSSLPLSIFNHFQTHFQLFLCCQLQLIPSPIFLLLLLSVTMLRPPPISLWLRIPLTTLWLKTLLTTLHLVSVFSLKTCLWISLSTLIFMIHQLINPPYLPSHQKPVLHWPQNLTFHLPLYLKQQSKLICLTSSQKCHLRRSMQSGERGREKMQRKTKRSMQNENKEMRQKNYTGRLIGGRIIKFHRASGGKDLKRRERGSDCRIPL